MALNDVVGLVKALKDKKVRVHVKGLEWENEVTHYVVGRVTGALPGILILESLQKKNHVTKTQRRIERYIPYDKIIMADTAEEVEINYNHEDNNRSRG